MSFFDMFFGLLMSIMDRSCLNAQRSGELLLAAVQVSNAEKEGEKCNLKKELEIEAVRRRKTQMPK